MARRADKAHAVEQAQLARVHLGVGLDAPLPDILKLIEDVERIPVTVMPLPDGVAGAIGRKRGRSFIFINSTDQPVRRRFTLAHEYGHFVLGHPSVVDKSSDIGPKEGGRSPAEVEANYFASEFLAPEQAVRGFLRARRIEEIDLRTVVGLGTFFGISASAARIRFEAIGELKPREIAALDGQIQARQHLKIAGEEELEGPRDALSRERIELADHRVPGPAFARVAHACSHGLASLDRLAAQVGLAPVELERELHEAGVEVLDRDED